MNLVHDSSDYCIFAAYVHQAGPRLSAAGDADLENIRRSTRVPDMGLLNVKTKGSRTFAILELSRSSTAAVTLTIRIGCQIRRISGAMQLHWLLSFLRAR